MAEPMIYKAINDVMADIGAIGKNQKNLQQGFMFRGIDAVMNAISPSLIKHKVFVVPEVLEQTREERQTSKGGTLIYSICKVKYTFFTVDGSSITATVIGEGMDSGDKATNKAMSIAFKYACFQVFCIPTEEMKDPDEEAHEVKPRKAEEKKSVVDIAEQKISAEKATALLELLTSQGIELKTIFELYNVKSVTDLKEKQHANIVKNLEKIKEKQEAKHE